MTTLKHLLTYTIILATGVGAFAQGKVGFGNDSAHLYLNGDSYLNDPLGPIPVSPLPSGRTLESVLYAGTSAGSLSLQTVLVLDAAGWLTDGRQVNKNIILTGVPGGSVAYFQIFVTDTGAVLPSTIIGGSPGGFNGAYYNGTSGLFTSTPGASLIYPGLVSGGPSGSTWTGPITVVTASPEPSSMVLAGLGAASLFLFRRRQLKSL